MTEKDKDKSKDKDRDARDPNNKTTIAPASMTDGDKQLYEKSVSEIQTLQYYHGLLPREDINSLLKKPGEYLVRTTEPKSGQPRQIVLSYFPQEDNRVKHFILSFSGGLFHLDQIKAQSLPGLITQLYKSPIKGKHFLKYPVKRQAWELCHCDIEVTKKLGEGAFGEVSLGKLTVQYPPSSVGTKLDVAIKLAKLENLTKEQIKEIMREARLMRMFDHPNVVKLYGVAAGQEPLMLVMELCDKGALDSYLVKNHLELPKKMEMCAQAAYGIEYLHSKHVIHRDIAARNCLYGNNLVKISDFGLTREGDSYKMSKPKPVPIRWLAPETMVTIVYTQKTDVFSYGILCWEILNDGQEPYPGMTVAEVNVKVRGGYRLEVTGCSDEFKKLLEDGCLSFDADKRFSAFELAKKMEKLTGLEMPKYVSTNEVSSLPRLTDSNQLKEVSSAGKDKDKLESRGVKRKSSKEDGNTVSRVANTNSTAKSRQRSVGPAAAAPRARNAKTG